MRRRSCATASRMSWRCSDSVDTRSRIPASWSGPRNQASMLAFTFATNSEMRGIAPEAAIATSPPRMSKLNT